MRADRADPSVYFRDLKVPLYPRIVNYGITSFAMTADLIDAIDSRCREWKKVNVLVNDYNYLQFLSNMSKANIEAVVTYLNEFQQDLQFRQEFAEKLQELDSSGIVHADDLRFHSLSIYCLVRILRPFYMIETGVAQGKSSAMALLAMHHNGKGRLVSVDLPNSEGQVLADGARTSTGNREVGWLVPEFLRARWDLQLGDSRDLLPKILHETSEVPNIFFHDSLHTYEHTKFELQTVLQRMRSGLVICDNIEMGSGRALHEILGNRNAIAHGYRDFAGFMLTESCEG